MDINDTISNSVNLYLGQKKRAHLKRSEKKLKYLPIITVKKFTWAPFNKYIHFFGDWQSHTTSFSQEFLMSLFQQILLSKSYISSTILGTADGLVKTPKFLPLLRLHSKGKEIKNKIFSMFDEA